MKLVAKREKRENGLCAARAAHNVRRIAGVQMPHTRTSRGTRRERQVPPTVWCNVRRIQCMCGNDPSAGSPTETLLRLHLPLNDEV